MKTICCDWCNAEYTETTDPDGELCAACWEFIQQLRREKLDHD